MQFSLLLKFLTRNDENVHVRNQIINQNNFCQSTHSYLSEVAEKFPGVKPALTFGKDEMKS